MPVTSTSLVKSVALLDVKLPKSLPIWGMVLSILCPLDALFPILGNKLPSSYNVSNAKNPYKMNTKDYIKYNGNL